MLHVITNSEYYQFRRGLAEQDFLDWCAQPHSDWCNDMARLAAVLLV